MVILNGPISETGFIEHISQEYFRVVIYGLALQTKVGIKFGQTFREKILKGCVSKDLGFEDLFLNVYSMVNNIRKVLHDFLEVIFLITSNMWVFLSLSLSAVILILNRMMITR